MNRGVCSNLNRAHFTAPRLYVCSGPDSFGRAEAVGGFINHYYVANEDEHWLLHGARKYVYIETRERVVVRTCARERGSLGVEEGEANAHYLTSRLLSLILSPPFPPLSSLSPSIKLFKVSRGPFGGTSPPSGEEGGRGRRAKSTEKRNHIALKLALALRVVKPTVIGSIRRMRKLNASHTTR